MQAAPGSTKASLTSRLNLHARTRWLELTAIEVRFRANFAYVDGRYGNGDTITLCRLRNGGLAHTWGFAIYRASRDVYEDSYLPSGMTAGSAEGALDCACGLYLNDPSAWNLDRPTTSCRRQH
jgi:hypothetical protein